MDGPTCASKITLIIIVYYYRLKNLRKKNLNVDSKSAVSETPSNVDKTFMRYYVSAVDHCEYRDYEYVIIFVSCKRLYPNEKPPADFIHAQ